MVEHWASCECALWAQPQKDKDGPPERLVTWTTHRMEHAFVFTGGIIMTANRPFPDQPELDAIKTRIAYMHLVVSDSELKAKMRHIANNGYRQGRDQINPDDCREVCEFVIQKCLGLNRAPGSAAPHQRLLRFSPMAGLRFRMPLEGHGFRPRQTASHPT